MIKCRPTSAAGQMVDFPSWLAKFCEDNMCAVSHADNADSGCALNYDKLLFPQVFTSTSLAVSLVDMLSVSWDGARRMAPLTGS